ncbi:SOS response-associated peptidase [Aureimonas frigidaquae]|uniref:SOS response-associated peptidase n=1 Tax=Aureimonas frigidaquae TaxID=424757 RepID=UPI00078574FD|nr:SOS response-associated peptidase [Aureimonas frigidaquae]
MTGRFSLTHPAAAVAARFAIAEVEPFPPRYNIAPTQPILIVIGGKGQRPEAYRPGHQAMLARWGLIPSWCRDPSAAPLLYNARAETVLERNAFRAAFLYRRCIVPASGFYAWVKGPAEGAAVPHYVQPADGRMMALAGLLETYMAPDGGEIDTVALLTRTSTGRLAPLGPREPVLLAPDGEAGWLDCLSVGADEAAAICMRRPTAELAIERVSDRVNSVANLSPDVQAPADRQAPGGERPPG